MESLKKLKNVCETELQSFDKNCNLLVSKYLKKYFNGYFFLLGNFASKIYFYLKVQEIE